jgi:hypothetical protein
LLSDGSLDPSFTSGADPSSVDIILLQANGDLIINAKPLDQKTIPTVQRLRADGTVDPEFHIDMTYPKAIAKQDDGRLLVSGKFDSGDIGVKRYSLPEPVNETFSLEGSTVTWMREGALSELASAPVLQISTNGTSFSTVAPMQRIANGWRVSGVNAPIGSAFLLRVEGSLRSGMFNASTGIAQTTKRFQRSDRLYRDGFE